jgi:hypothetical protein
MLLDMMAHLGGILMAFKWLFGLVAPLFILWFLQKLSEMIQLKQQRAYREGLNEVALRTFL